MSKEIVTGIYEAFGRGDLAGVLGALADGVEWEMAGPAPFAGRRQGRDGVQGFFMDLMGAVKIEMFEVDAVIGDGEQVVVLGRERCTVKRTGRSYEQHWAHAYTVREGKVAAVRLYEDTQAQAVAFGQWEILRALNNYRKRLYQRGMARFEVLGLDGDRDLIRSLARRLAGGDPDSARIRAAVRRNIAGEPPKKGVILDALRRSPLVGADLDLKRPVTPGRKVDL